MPTQSVELLRKNIEFNQVLRNHEFSFQTTWGLFNPKRVDQGSKLLIDYVEADLHAECLDLGCGYGAIGLVLAKLSPSGRIHMVDKDFVAIDYAKQNAKRNGINNCEIYLSNGLNQIPLNQRFDLVASNLPAKVGNELLSIFLHDAHNRLKPGGKLFVVTIAGLKEYIKRNFRDIFGNYTKIKQRNTFLLSMAEKI